MRQCLGIPPGSATEQHSPGVLCFLSFSCVMKQMKTFSSQKGNVECEFPSVLSQYKQTERKKNSKTESMLVALFHPAALGLRETACP